MTSLLKDHYTKVYFYLLDVINTCDKPKTKQQRLRLESKSSPQVEKYEPPHRRKKKSNGYDTWLHRCTWIPKTTKLKVEEPS